MLAQTYKNIEIIIIDDASTDNSYMKIEKMIMNNENIRYYRQPKNMGVAAARNRGIKLANGQYIAFLDSDDLWKQDKLEKQVKIICEKGAEIVFTAIKIIDKDGKLIKNKRKIKERINYKFLLSNTMIATSSVLLALDKIGKFQMPLLHLGEDYATWLMLMRNGREAYGINEALTLYRKSARSLSSKKLKNWKVVWNIQVKFEGVCPVKAYINCLRYAVNSVKKYFL